MDPVAYLNTFASPQREIAQRVRTVLLKAVPTFTERVLTGWKAVAFRDPQAGHVCAIFPLEEEVRLYFEFGSLLEDPAGRLHGSHMKRGRYLALRNTRDIRAAEITAFARSAVAIGSL